VTYATPSEPRDQATAATQGTLPQAQAIVEQLRRRLTSVIVGRDDTIELVLIALLADGHVLLEDFPGSGKTTLARALGESIAGSKAESVAGSALVNTGNIVPFRRIQFTPDLLPSDVTGTTVFDPDSRQFSFRPGPIFAHVVLADEINRTSPKVQSAMLEAMAEKQVTVDNETHKLDDLFFVIATQNPLDLAGTYPLPTPQLDRFLFKIEMKHIARDAELSLLSQYPQTSLERGQGLPPVTRDQLLSVRRSLRAQVAIHPAIREALVDTTNALRADKQVLQGTSTRSLVLLMPALQARALLHGRDYVSPEDVEMLAPHVFKHRVETAPGVTDALGVIQNCLRPALEQLARHSLKR
jgi:MoxR-like ATPase